jgi:AMP-polyphosphate phosphotransferase
MFEAAEVGRAIAKEVWDLEVPKMRADLLAAQLALRSTRVPVILIVSGADGAGKGETVNRLHEWLDTRGLETHVFGPLSDEERDRPCYWRFWRTLPARGRIGIFFGSWYTDPIVRRVYGRISTTELDDAMARVAFFEKMLVEDGALILKFWFHLAKQEQKRRLRRLERDPATSWRVSPDDWKHFELYDRFRKHSERALARTDTGHAPWHVVEATDDRYRELTAGRTLLAALQRAVTPAPAAPPAAPAPPAAAAPAGGLTILDRVDLTRTVTDNAYRRELAKLQARLSELAREAYQRRQSSVAVFEGWDAAGKGGAIRRVAEAMDARDYRVISVAAPTDEERTHHYLWRFWRHIPRAGTMTLYDRSWYGRVLVERVEGFATEAEWARAYAEINDFEAQLVGHGMVLAKFWLHIGKSEQLARFREREKVVYKRHKITDEDWRNRKRWARYEEAVNEMVARTSTRAAPWTIVPANDKRVARLTVLRTLCRGLEQAL